ncbi:hypothetical protein PC129_g14629 [Phytophthora cactorum]|uniref:Uncharacterized protein n=1 Tax=Phytophthora cactorum TaxID=29920 RepID=A0A8T1KB87_9STRA|nr:hypothetical protein PC114_g20471 [Phytophthora cactorum]KAG3010648.1 hypothetical protein PC120_g14938 [Phytophthora cactorum]KAG3137965.1 hypothetical protein C6341_g20816 [Phytophthora cactorum]KAG3214457.1 hypothetical protein PC129_g14629 [Phytophthora cactorum]KAG4232976.1 hypothetical protein PC116_g18795 [Phytophthora cactorum]
MTSLMAERLNGDHGTGVTAMDTNQRALYGATAEALNELTVVKQKPYIAQITVWDPRQTREARVPVVRRTCCFDLAPYTGFGKWME